VRPQIYARSPKHEARLAQRLAKDKVDALGEDLGQLGVHVPGAIVAKGTSKAATAGQNTALAQAYALVSATRFNVGQQAVGDDVKSGWGVGHKVNASVVSHVNAAIGMILDRVKEHPDEPQKLGLLDTDLQKLAAAQTALQAADAQQEDARAKAPRSTLLRNQTANRILATTRLIAGAGVAEFALEPERAER
jgi:hypothetical protein